MKQFSDLHLPSAIKHQTSLSVHFRPAPCHLINDANLNSMSKLHIIYIVIIAALLLALCCMWQSKVIFWQTTDAVHLEPGTAITIWAAVLTIVFLVFSIVGLINIDHRISELNKTKEEMQKTSLEMREQLTKLKTSTDEEREKIVKGAEAELKKIINESAIRQNLFDELGRVAADPASMYAEAMLLCRCISSTRLS